MDTSSRETTFRDAYERHHGEVLAYFLRRLPRDDAIDAAADVFLTAWRRCDDLPGGEDTKLWLFGIAHNVLRNRNRSYRRVGRLVAKIAAEPAPHPTPPEILVLRRATDERIVRALEDLRPADAEIIRLRLWEELPHQQIATVLGCSRHAAEQRYAKALRRLRSACHQTGHVWTSEARSVSQEQETQP